MQARIGQTGRDAGLRSGPVCPQLGARPIARVCRTAAVAAAPVQLQPEDKWVAQTVKNVPTPSSLVALRNEVSSALTSMRMPSTRNEEYRFTDISALLKADVQPAPAGAAVAADFVSSHVFPEAAGSVAVVVDGVLRPELSQLAALPQGVYVGSISGAPAEAAAQLGKQANARGGPFAVLNAALAQDALVVVVPAGTELAKPLYVLHLASGGSNGATLANAPRLLVHVGKGAIAEVVEEYVGASSAGGSYFTCSVSELVLEEQAQVKHSYAQREAVGSYHFKCTLVRQAASSQYTFTEACIGGSLVRHDLNIQQEGPETETHMGHFLLCGSNQLHDLHSKLELNHPNGQAKQLHKCIVSHASGKGVFDGSVKVNRLAQKSDAGQLSRNLLLVPLATVNVKPNLQIIADDVKCTHGCAISDLRDDELFYFRARGINAEAARQALVFSFGAEVVQHMKYPALVQRVQADVSRTLKTVEQFAASPLAVVP